MPSKAQSRTNERYFVLLEERSSSMTLQQVRVAVLEARMSSEMADLVRRYGGIPVSVPAVREVPLNCAPEVSEFIEAVVCGAIRTVVFFTGVGANTLFHEAEKLGRLAPLLAALQNLTIVCRGPKPSAVVRKMGLDITLSAREPFTTHELLAELDKLELSGQVVGVVHYGERNEMVSQALHQRGATMHELCLYEWLLPEDTVPLQHLVNQCLQHHIDAIAFTSQVQVRHLFLVASGMGCEDQLAMALQKNVVVASVGPTCTAVLQKYQVVPHVLPAHPKMGHLIKALADYFTS
jgi:uroporphyrinogen-III synthase